MHASYKWIGSKASHRETDLEFGGNNADYANYFLESNHDLGILFQK